MELVYSHIAQDSPKGKRTNISIAHFTAAQARLKLNEHLDRLDDRVLYQDTDYLGETISELGADDYITEFVSGVAKNYGHIKNKGRVEVRGFI